jgi:superfamily II DNA or RNA helicase
VAGEVLSGLAFQGRWRQYQRNALDAFERDRQAGRRRTHVVAPPGSGKTLLGVEMVRRLGVPALVLAPTSAIQAQWPRMVARFTDAPGVAAADPQAPVACLTYQAFCQLDDPADALRDLACRRWAAERAAATGMPVAEVEREAAGWRGAAARRRARELARVTAAIKREIARGEHAGVALAGLLAPGPRERVELLRRRGVGTVVLDECHHLASLWGYVVRAVVDALGDVHLIGLTATPPEGLSQSEAELYQGLLGPVDYTIPTPAVVREGHLAPFQELAWLTRPLDAEARWLAEHDLRFEELVTALHEEDGGEVLSFPAWVSTRLRVREPAGGEARLPWAAFGRRHPTLARAGVRFLASAGLPLPEGAPRGEGYRERPGLDDWLVLLEDYALRCLRAHPSPEGARRYDEIGVALRDLGFTLTRQGIRRGASDVDRLLVSSAAKTIALVDVVGLEYDARGLDLRALVLTDAELPGAQRAGALTGVLRPEAGTAAEAVRALAADLRTGTLRPLLVSGRGLRCAPEDADALLESLREQVDELLAGAQPRDAPVGRWRAEPGAGGLVRLLASGPGWRPRLWVELATSILTRGETRALVATRALLGEGWDAPCVNCLVDLTAAATGVAVRQMRGRSLRLDPSDPGKLASNWDVVCVAPELARGTADYERFVRKHLHLLAPSEDGIVEAGPSHVHPRLGPFAPPPSDDFGAINQTMAARAQALDQARERWGIGRPYADRHLDTLVVRARAGAPAAPPPPVPVRGAAVPPAYPLDQRGPLALAGAAGVAAPAAALLGGEPLLLGLAAVAPAALGWALHRLGRTERALADVPPLDLAGHAVADAYLELGELSKRAAASLAVEPRASGYLRCHLRDADPEESARFTAALADALGPAEAHRYLISRLVPGRRRGAARRLARLLSGRRPFEVRWTPVPADLGRSRVRAEVFARAWRRWLGPGELRFTQRSDEGRQALAEAVAQAVAYESSVRRIWT